MDARLLTPEIVREHARRGTVPETVGSEADGIFFKKGSEAEVVPVAALDNLKLSDALNAKVLLPGPKASLIEFQLSQGQSIPPHRYPHSTIYYVVSGQVSVTLAGTTYEAQARDAWAAVEGVEISLTTQADSVVLEWMSSPHLLLGKQLMTWGPIVPAESHMFVEWASVDQYELMGAEGKPEERVGDEVPAEIRVLIPGPNASLVWAIHRPPRWALHAHQHHFVCYLIKGKVREKFGGSVDVVAGPGDIWGAQAGADHCTVGLEQNELLEFKWPAPLYIKGTIHSWDPQLPSRRTIYDHYRA
jgi:quercetin dioxygenase-like cupin family protein